MRLADGNKPINVGDTSFIYKGVYHPIYWIGTEPYRPRVETLVIKDGEYVYANLDDNIESIAPDLRYKHYSLPGGSLDNDSTKIQQAEAETNEEALIKVSLLYNTGVSYYELYEPGFIAKGGDTPLEYVGSISDIFIGVYDGPYDKSLVEEKDLDPKMAEHGKFHKIVDISKYLRKEHIHALLASQFIKDDVKVALRLGRKDVINESTNSIVIPDKYIYHGSTFKIEEFKPMSLDLGNYNTEPGWSTFCFNKYETARMFGFMRAIQKNFPDANIDFVKNKLRIDTKTFRYFKENDLFNHKVNFYVYTIDSTGLNIGFGNDPTIEEYTFRESGVKPIETDMFELSMMDFKDVIDVSDSKDKDEINSYKTLLTHDYNTEIKVREALKKAISNGELNPGDDVKKYMEDNNLSFDNDDIKLPDLSLDIDEPVLEGFTDILYSLMEESYPIECYGLPDRKAYPMPDKKHVKSAIKFFNYAKPSEEKELADKINEKIKEYKITDISVGDKNRFKKYYKPISESYSLSDYGEALKTLLDSVTSETSDNKRYALYEQSKNVIRLMLTNLEAGTICEGISDEDLSLMINQCYLTLAEINQNQMEIITKEPIQEDTSSELFKSIIESMLHPVMEADDDKPEDEENTDGEEDETATDYTVMADDAMGDEGETPEEDTEGGDTEEDGEDTATDYTAMADDAMGEDEGADEPTEDTPEENTEDTPDDTTEPEPTEEETGEDTGDDATDYTAMADDAMGDEEETPEEDTEGGDTEGEEGGTDETTTDDTTTDTDTEENTENNNRYDNKELKNYFLLNSFLSIHETVVDVLDSVTGMILPTPDANNIMAKVIKNLQTVKSFIEKFIQFQFSDKDYAFNLYYYNIIINAVKMNLNIFNEAIKIGETKTTKKETKKGGK